MSEASGAVPGPATTPARARQERPPRPSGDSPPRPPPLTRKPHRQGLDHMDVEKALAELQSTPMAQIERTTALTWGGRAAASYKLARDAQGSDGTDPHAAFRHFYEGENYRQEALEHAAMAEDRGRLLLAIHDELEVARGEALAALKGTASPLTQAGARPARS